MTSPPTTYPSGSTLVLRGISWEGEIPSLVSRDLVVFPWGPDDQDPPFDTFYFASADGGDRITHVLCHHDDHGEKSGWESLSLDGRELVTGMRLVTAMLGSSSC